MEKNGKKWKKKVFLRKLIYNFCNLEYHPRFSFQKLLNSCAFKND